MVLEGSARVQALEAEGSRLTALGATCACVHLGSRRSNGFGIIIPETKGGMCYRHNLAGPRNGPRATWAEGNHRNGLQIGFCANMSRAGKAAYLIRIV
jgi:hypothetical protein